jgi:pimeloyl-ACP methyl ester carboxylesterase
MPAVSNDGVTIRYDVVGAGLPLILLHGWVCDRSWWISSGYTDELQRDYRVVNVDLRGHGESDKPHDPSDYRSDVVMTDVLAVTEAEGIDRFAIWGLSYGGWIGWKTAHTSPERVSALITSGAWDPSPGTREEWEAFDGGWLAAIRRDGMRGLIEVFREEDGDAFPREFGPWAHAVTLRADPEAMLAIQTWENFSEGLATLDGFPVPVLLIAGALEDPDDDAAAIATVVPNGERLRLPGLGHGGACAASGLTLPTARAFLQRWYA